MSADILTDATYPHGTPAGFRGGCRGGACPAPVTCRDVFTRYNGDYAFRKAVDAGIPVAEFIATEARIAETTRAAQAARRPARVGRAQQKRLPGVASTENQAQVLALYREGMTDKEIAVKLGKTRDQVTAVRKHLALPVHRRESTDDRIRACHAQGMNDIQIAKHLNLGHEHISTRRRVMGLVRIPVKQRRISDEQMRDAHARGLTDRQVANEFMVDPRTAAKRRRSLGLPLNPAP